MGHDQEDTQIIMMPSKTKGRGEKKNRRGKKERLSEGREEEEAEEDRGGKAFVCCVWISIQMRGHVCCATLPRGALSRVPSVRWQRLTPQLPGEDESELSWCPQPLTYSTPLHIKGALEWSQATPASQPDNNTPPPPPHFQQFLLALPGTHLGPNDGRWQPITLKNSASSWLNLKIHLSIILEALFFGGIIIH